jgi:hypothetical protein
MGYDGVMADVSEDTPLTKLRTALDLSEAAEDIVRQNLRRRMPGATEAEIEERVTSWLRDRPGAELGDAVGRPTNRFQGA